MGRGWGEVGWGGVGWGEVGGVGWDGLGYNFGPTMNAMVAKI